MAIAGLLGSLGALPAAAAASLQAGQIANLVGLQRGDHGSRTDLEIANRGSVPASCELTLQRADGTEIGVARTLTVSPASPLTLLDLLADQSTARDVRARISCDQDFSASAVVSTPTERRVVGAARDLQVAPDGTSTCATGHVCYDYLGVVHTSTPANPARFITLTPPPGNYGTVKVHLEVQVNAFSRPSAAAHGLLYMVRNDNKDMFASAFLRGPHTNLFTLRHGFNQVSADKAKLTTPFTPVLTHTYALDYVFDPAHKTLNMTLTGPNGQQAAHLSDVPNVTSLPFGAGNFILISLSNSGVHNGKPNPQEPASLSWVYSNFHVEMVPVGTP